MMLNNIREYNGGEKPDACNFLRKGLGTIYRPTSGNYFTTIQAPFKRLSTLYHRDDE
jgi:hypothetical protein